MSIILHKIWTLFELKYTCPAFIMQIWRRYMSARVTLILINEEYQIMTGDIVYKDLIQLDLDVTTTWFTKSHGRIHLLIVPQKNPDDRYFSNRHQDYPFILFSAAVQYSLPASHPAVNHIN